MSAPDRIWAWPDSVTSADGLWLARDPTGDTRWADEFVRLTPELAALIEAANNLGPDDGLWTRKQIEALRTTIVAFARKEPNQ